MGFLDRIFKGEKKAEASVRRLNFPELPSWVGGQRASLEKGLSEGGREMVGRLPGILEDIEEKLGELEKAEMHKSVEQRIRSIVSSSRDNYVSGTRKALSGLSGEDLLALSNGISDTLDKIKNLDQRYGERVSFGFREQVSRVKKELNKLVDLSKDMEGAIGEGRKKLEILKAAQEEIGGVEGILKEIEGLEERASEVRRAVKEAEKDREQDERRISQIRVGDESRKYDELKSKLATLEARRGEIRSAILNMLGPLRRVMKKYKKAIDSGRAASMGNLSRYLNEPVETFLNGDNTLPDVLVGLQKAVQSGALEMDKAESEKVVKKIRAISFSYMEKLRSECNVLGSNIRSVELSMARYDVNKEIEELERDMEGKAKKSDREGKSLEKVEREIAAKREEISGIESKLGEKLSQYTGGRVEIVY